MKILSYAKRLPVAGNALLLTLIMCAIALMAVAGALSYAATNARLTFRSNQYSISVAAAEAATEKVLTQMSADYLSGGEALVAANLSTYQGTYPMASDSSYWGGWEFTDASGHKNQTYVQAGAVSNYMVLNSAYAGLKGYATIYTVVSDARQKSQPQDVTGAVMEQLQLARVPVFQFMGYSMGDLEISCGQPFTVLGRMHSNGQLYVEPDNVLTFQSDVTAVGNILFSRSPLDSRGAPAGSVVYQGRKDSHVAALTLPIGTTNTPTAVREIIQPPPLYESATSSLGRVRYYNLADMLLIVTNAGTNFSVTGCSGNFNGFATTIPTNEINLFVITTNKFYDWRESKTVKTIGLNIGILVLWSATNNTLRTALGGRDVGSIYVWDRRSLTATNLAAVRVFNGAQLPPRGLSVATHDPLYVWGTYNQPTAANLGTTNTSTSLPASLVGDAITILSTNWTDANSTATLSSRGAKPTTVNAAILAGAVETVNGNYGGGMENFPRFLESWGSDNAFTYNGSMVKMFPSLYATNTWGKTNVYDPPARNWAYDANFDNPAKLPPLTPSLQKVVRAQWATLAPNQTAVVAH